MAAKDSETDPAREIATLIAAEVTPGEQELAGVIFDAMIAGGQDAADLDRKDAGAVLGGMGLDSVSQLYPLIACLASCASILSSIMSTRAQSLVIRAHKAAAQDEGDAESPADDDQLDGVIVGIVRELRKRGVPADRANELSRKTLDVLLRDPTKSLQFITALSGSAG